MDPRRICKRTCFISLIRLFTRGLKNTIDTLTGRRKSKFEENQTDEPRSPSAKSFQVVVACDAGLVSFLFDQPFASFTATFSNEDFWTAAQVTSFAGFSLPTK